jgi:CheY-like chemotaxis protein
MADEAAGGQGAFGAQKLVLVCETAPERLAVVKAALEQIGYTMLPATTAEEATERIRRQTFEIMIVDEQFESSGVLDNAVLKLINTLPIGIRRHMFVVLLGREFKTFDNMMAFTRSANVVVNLNDLPHLPAILKKGLEDNNDFYRVFRDMLAEVGKR